MSSGGETYNVARGDTCKAATKKRKELAGHTVPNLAPNERKRYHAYMSHNTVSKSNANYLGGDSYGSGTLTPHQSRAMARRKHDKKQRHRINVLESKRTEAAISAAEASAILETEPAGFIEAESEMEFTYKLTQDELRRHHLDENTARHIFDLSLTQYSPYGMKYDASGRHSILYGARGHVSMMDNHAQSLQCEFYLTNETVRDVCFLHNQSLFACAQRKCVYIYDNKGAEIHELDTHKEAYAVDFLPYHWLLASVGRTGWLKYHDTSTGQFVSEHRTKLGPCNVMRQNTQNAVIHLGHGKGTVTMWSPATSDYLVKMQCHRGPILGLAVDHTGKYMATTGADRQIKIWDLRTYKNLYSYHTMNHAPATTLDFSQRGILGVGHGYMTTFWNNPLGTRSDRGPYMTHKLNGKTVQTLRFRPYEDVCGIGHSHGISSIVIPGSGEPNLDSLENANPYAEKKQWREMEVRSLLDKLSPEMISLDPNMIGRITRSKRDETLANNEIMNQADHANTKGKIPIKEKNKMRGRNKLGKKLARKHKNIVDAQVLKLREAREKEKQDEARAAATEKGELYLTEKEKKKANAPAALKRFFN